MLINIIYYLLYTIYSTGVIIIIKKLICISIALLFIGITSAQSLDEIKKSEYNPKMLIRIDEKNIDLLNQNFEIVGSKTGKYIDVIVNKNDIGDLNLKEDEIKVLIEDVGLYDQSVLKDYSFFPEIESFLNDISTTYPEITSLSSIGKSYENRDIWLIEISDNPGIDENEPGIFFMGLHHAREWPTVEICLYIIEQLTTLYDSDDEIKNIVDNRRIFISPCVNPDGYVYSHDIGYDWRKNRHEFPEFSTVGVDLNRNYAGSSNGDALGCWGSISGSVSNRPISEVYCGPSPMSELETLAVKNVFLNYDLSASISWHTFGELVMWPWGYSTDIVTPDDDYMSQVGINIANRIGTQEGQGLYTPSQSSGLYPTSGDTTDWAYGYYHYVLGKPMFAYTIEACSSFHPSSSFLDQIVEENFNGAVYLLKEADNIRNVTPRVIPPVINQIEILSDNNLRVSWEESNIQANPSFFQLEELSNLEIVLDDAEADSDKWILDGFSISDSKSNSGRYSYYGAKKQGRVFTMKTKHPIFFQEDMNLSFMCYYKSYENQNVGFVEISKDDRYYDVIDRFTGDSDGWIKKEYPLDDYNGESIFIRFRVSGESFDTGSNGYYFDDIYPVAFFDNEKIISSDIVTNSYEIEDKEDGTYYYRVKGFNEEHGWGDYSCLKKVLIGNKAPNRPDSPVGEINGITGNIYEYTALTTDHEEDNIYYMFDWGDGTKSRWLGPFESGTEITKSNVWNNTGTYYVRVKAKDTYGSESEWSESSKISMPAIKNFNFFKILLNKILFFINNILSNKIV